jgi:hypothetical protein
MSEGRMDTVEAKRRIAIMREIALDYGALAAKDEPRFPDSC